MAVETAESIVVGDIRAPFFVIPNWTDCATVSHALGKRGSFMSGYPEGVEVVWVGRDNLGYVGAFVTAGYGPLPRAVKEYELIMSASLEDYILASVSVTTRANLESENTPGDTSSFLALAQRGLFVFDWTDTCKREKTRKYELVAKPLRPLQACYLPVAIGMQAVHLPKADFTSIQQIDIVQHVPCYGP